MQREGDRVPGGGVITGAGFEKHGWRSPTMAFQPEPSLAADRHQAGKGTRDTHGWRRSSGASHGQGWHAEQRPRRNGCQPRPEHMTAREGTDHTIVEELVHRLELPFGATRAC